MIFLELLVKKKYTLQDSRNLYNNEVLTHIAF